MLPRVFEVQTLVPAVVTDPVAALGVDVRGVRVTGLIVEIALFALHGSRRIRFRLLPLSAMRFGCSMRCGCRMRCGRCMGCWLRSVLRDIAVPDSSAAMLLRLTTLVLTTLVLTHRWSALDQTG